MLKQRFQSRNQWYQLLFVINSNINHKACVTSKLIFVELTAVIYNFLKLLVNSANVMLVFKTKKILYTAIASF